MPPDPVALVEIIEREFSFLIEAGYRSTVEGDNSVSYEHPGGLV